MDYDKIQARRAARMARIYKKRGRARSIPTMRLTVSEKGNKQFQIYGPKQIHS